MGLILDLAVAAVTLVVLGSLALLAWTVAVGVTRATGRARERVAGLRATVADARARLSATTDRYDTRGDATSE